MKRPIKILHVIRSLSPENGGPMEGIRRLAQIARQQNYELEAVSLDPPDAPFLKHLPFAAHALGPAVGRYGYSSKLVPWMRANAHRFDGVVINGLWQYHGFGTWRVLAGKVPFVVFTHGMLDPYFKKRYPLKHAKKWIYWALFEFWMLRRANAVLFTSPLEKVLAEESFWLRQWNPVVVPYGTTGPDFDIEESIYSFHEAHPQLRDKRFILYLSRIDPKKGCDLLIDAFAKVSAIDPSLYLVIAGPDLGNLVPKLQQQAQERGIAHRILWPGMLRDAIKWGAFYTSEVYILPSHQENFGIAVSEAMACGKAVLTTDKVNIWPDILESGSGYIESDTVEGIENLLRRWINTPQEERDAMGQRALVTFGERFNMRRTATSILKELGHNLPEGAAVAVPEVSR